MGLYKFKPAPSSRMGAVYTLSTIRESVLIELGAIDNLFYSNVTFPQREIEKYSNIHLSDMNEYNFILREEIKLEYIIEDIFNKHNPKVIFIVNGDINNEHLVDIDLEKMRSIYPNKKIFKIPYGNINTEYSEAIEKTLLFLVKELGEICDKTKDISFNIIGSCCDMYNYQFDIEEINRILSNTLNIKANCIMTSDTSISDIENIGAGHINLVIREEGVKTAKYLKKRFNTPYIFNRPYGVEGTIQWLDEIVDILGLEKNMSYIEEENKWLKSKYDLIKENLLDSIELCGDKGMISLGGHKDIVKGILEFGTNELSLRKGSIWCDSMYLENEDIPYYTKDEWTKVFENEKGIIMGSGEAIEAFCKNGELQISNPTKTWGIDDAKGPLVGFRGAYELVSIWSKNLDNK